MPYIGRAPTASITKLEDADRDTKIQVEESSDEDIIRFDTGGAERMTVASGGTVDVVGDLTVGTVTADGDTSAGDSATIGYTAAEGLILTGQGSTNDITIKNDADADVITIATGGTDVEISTGNLVIGTSGKGIDFSATADGPTMSSELFDDYEEGTWTPVIRDSSDSGTIMAISTSATSYTKIGRMCTVQGLFRRSDVQSLTGTMFITALPFTSGNTLTVLGNLWLDTATDLFGRAYVGNGQSYFLVRGGDDHDAYWTTDQLLQNGYIYFGITYQTT